MGSVAGPKEVRGFRSRRMRGRDIIGPSNRSNVFSTGVTGNGISLWDWIHYVKDGRGVGSSVARGGLNFLDDT